MAFSFSKKSIQNSKDSQMMGIQTIQDKNVSTEKPSGAPDQIKYINKLELATVNERGMDDLTGASYVSDVLGFSPGNVVCVGAVYTAQLALNSTIPGVGTGARVIVGAGVAKACNETIGAVVDYVYNYEPSSGDQGDPMEQGSFGIEEPDNGDSNGNEDGNTDPDTDTTSNNDDNDDNDDNDASDADSDGDSWWASLWESITGDEDTEAGGDDSNPNPEADGSQGSTSKPTIGPAPGDIGGRYDSVVNPGAERGFTPGNDGGGDGNPGNPWDRNERMSTPNGDGDPIDPLTGFGGPSDSGGNGNGDDDGGSGFGSSGSDDPAGDGGSGFGSSGPGDDLWKPNPDDTWGGWS